MKIDQVELSHVRVFKEFVVKGSLEGAASSLGLTPSAVSVQLKNFEQRMELPLFVFSGKKKVLTPFGRDVFTETTRLLTEFSSGFERLSRQYEQDETQTLRVGGRRELFSFAASKLNFKGIVQFVQSTSEEAMSLLIDQKIDVAISRLVPDSTELRAKKLLRDSSCLIIPKKFPLKSSIEIEKNHSFIIETPVILFSKAAPLLTSWLEVLGLNVEQLNIKFVCDDWLSIVRLVSEGRGYSVVPLSLASSDEQFRSVPLPKTPGNDYYLVQRNEMKKFHAFKNLF